jgi:hypothetical protein
MLSGGTLVALQKQEAGSIGWVWQQHWFGNIDVAAALIGLVGQQ